MRFLKIELWTDLLDEQKAFYRDQLGLDILEKENSFSVQLGWTKLTFSLSEKSYNYHYCFLIASNHLANVIKWASNRFELIDVEGSVIVKQSPSWNAQSIYFYDGAGNIAEFIVRHNLDIKSSKAFDGNQIVCFNEIGLCSSNNTYYNQILESNLETSIYSGNLERFATHGDEEGLFLLIDNSKKDRWFPSNIPTDISPFKCSINHLEITKKVDFIEGELTIFD